MVAGDNGFRSRQGNVSFAGQLGLYADFGTSINAYQYLSYTRAYIYPTIKSVYS